MARGLFSILTILSVSGYCQEDFKLPVHSVQWNIEVPFAAGPRDDGSTFVIDGVGYYGCGADFDFRVRNDWWKFDPILQSWVEVASLPASPRQYALGFNSNDFGYLVSGLLDDGTFTSDMFIYDPQSDKWEELLKAPFTPRAKAAGFYIGTKYYLAGGISDSLILNDFWMFDTEKEAWFDLGELPFSARFDMIGFSNRSLGFFGLGVDSTGGFNELWCYDSDKLIWKMASAYPGASSSFSCAIAEPGGAFIIGGMNQDEDMLSECYHYSVFNDRWTKMDTIPKGRLRGIEGFRIENRVYLVGGLAKSFTRLDVVQSLQFSESRIAPQLYVWPTPCRSTISVYYNSALSDDWKFITVFDANGIQQKNYSVTKHTDVISLNVEDLSNGKYYLRVTAESGVKVASFVVTN